MTGSGNEITQLAEEFASCRRTLLALGDENRQHLILEMMQMKDCRGVCAGREPKIIIPFALTVKR